MTEPTLRLFLSTVDWPPIEGGIATLSEGLARALGRRGHRLEVYAPARPGARAPEQDGGLRVERWRGYDWGALRWLPFTLGAVRRATHADAVLAMNPAYGGLSARLGSVAGGPPYLAWAYGYELLKARGTPLAPLYRWLFEGARAVIAISHHTRELLLALGVSPDRIRIVHPGVDPPPDRIPDAETTRKALGIAPGPLVLTVGRLVPRKGHRVLLEALARVRIRHPDLRWAVVGRGPMAAEIAERARSRGLERNLHLLGYQPPAVLEGLFAAARLFALLPASSPADVEGYGIVFLEAGVRGIPVVAGASGGVPEAVGHDDNGLLVDPHDPAAAALAIDKILSSDELALRLGRGGRARGTARSWDQVASEVETLLR